jgi:hypothetical protein
MYTDYVFILAVLPFTAIYVLASKERKRFIRKKGKNRAFQEGKKQ